MKKSALVLLALIFIAALASCNSAPTVSAGNYYLDGNENNQYIQIISDTQMRLVGFDIDYLANYLVSQGTDLEGDEAEAFMKRHNLPNVFNEEITFEFDEHEKTIYVMALSSENAGYFVANYRMAYENGDTITFMENKYILR